MVRAVMLKRDPNPCWCAGELLAKFLLRDCVYVLVLIERL